MNTADASFGQLSTGDGLKLFPKYFINHNELNHCENTLTYSAEYIKYINLIIHTQTHKLDIISMY